MRLVKLTAYLQHNAGDDMMVEQLLNRYPNCLFYGCVPHQKKSTFMEESNYFDENDVYKNKVLGRLNHLINLLTFNKFKDLLYKFVFNLIEKQCKHAITIGGSIYRPTNYETIEERINRENKKRAANGSLYVVSANFGPYDTREFFEAFYSYFKKCSGVVFRDSRSHNLFKDIPQVTWAPDIVLNIPDRIIKINSNVVISVLGLKHHPHLIKYKTTYIKFIVDVCKHIFSLGLNPVLTSFCELEGDMELIDEILTYFNNYDKGKITVYSYNGNTCELIELFSNAKFIIATRFHSMILGIRFSKPLFTIVYELKALNVLEDLANHSWCHMSELANFDPIKVFETGYEAHSYEEYIKKASLQFSQLDKALS